MENTMTVDEVKPAVVAQAIVLPAFIVTRHDSNADGAGRHAALTIGVITALNARAARDKAYEKFNRNECQWFEVENVKYAKPARVRAARMIYVYEGA